MFSHWHKWGSHSSVVDKSTFISTLKHMNLFGFWINDSWGILLHAENFPSCLYFEMQSFVEAVGTIQSVAVLRYATIHKLEKEHLLFGEKPFLIRKKNNCCRVGTCS